MQKTQTQTQTSKPIYKRNKHNTHNKHLQPIKMRSTKAQDIHMKIIRKSKNLEQRHD